MTDEDFRLVPGTAVTPDLLWSGLVLLAERLRATSIDVAEHRRESAERHDFVISRLGHLEDRVAVLERTALTEPQRAHLVDDQRRSEERATSRAELSTHILKTIAAALALLLLGTLLVHFGLDPTGISHPPVGGH